MFVTLISNNWQLLEVFGNEEIGVHGCTEKQTAVPKWQLNDYGPHVDLLLVPHLEVVEVRSVHGRARPIQWQLRLQ